MSDGKDRQPSSEQHHPAGYRLSPDEQQRLTEMTVRDPDELLGSTRSSRLPLAVIVSILCHAAILAATSAALFADWRQYGLKLPATIRTEKQQLREAEEQADRDAKIRAEREAAADDETPEGTADGVPGSGSESTDGEVSSPENEDGEGSPRSFSIDEIDLGL